MKVICCPEGLELNPNRSRGLTVGSTSQITKSSSGKESGKERATGGRNENKQCPPHYEKLFGDFLVISFS